MGASYQADNFKPPIDGSVRAVVVGTTSYVTDLGETWTKPGKYVTFCAEGANVRLLFSSTSAVTSSLASGTSNVGVVLQADTPQSWRVARESRYVATFAAATTLLTMYLSSPE